MPALYELRGSKNKLSLAIDVIYCDARNERDAPDDEDGKEECDSGAVRVLGHVFSDG